MESELYDAALPLAFTHDWEEVEQRLLSPLALGETDSARFLKLWDAAERGYAEGLRLCAMFEALDMQVDAGKDN